MPSSPCGADGLSARGSVSECGDPGAKERPGHRHRHLGDHEPCPGGRRGLDLCAGCTERPGHCGVPGAVRPVQSGVDPEVQPPDDFVASCLPFELGVESSNLMARNPEAVGLGLSVSCGRCRARNHTDCWTPDSPSSPPHSSSVAFFFLSHESPGLILHGSKAGGCDQHAVGSRSSTLTAQQLHSAQLHYSRSAHLSPCLSTVHHTRWNRHGNVYQMQTTPQPFPPAARVGSLRVGRHSRNPRGVREMQSTIDLPPWAQA